ncbi:unnamed protein product, partial [marine sediment metagenome]
RILSRLDKQEKEIEIKKCKDFLDSILNYSPNIISYPFGHEGIIDAETLEILPKYHIKYGLTMYRVINNGTENPLLMHRFDVNDIFHESNLRDEYKS